MGPGASGTENNALADMVNQMANEAKRGATALMDEEVGTLGVPNPRILIVGCGGSGNNTLNRITHMAVEGAVTVAINTDKQHLDHTRALQKLLVGRHITRGLGAGGDPSTGRRCAEAGREMIRRIVTGADLVFIASGLGGGSGTGICPIVAEEAKAAGALVVGIVTTPFHVERRQRMTKALEGLESLRRVADAVAGVEQRAFDAHIAEGDPVRVRDHVDLRQHERRRRARRVRAEGDRAEIHLRAEDVRVGGVGNLVHDEREAAGAVRRRRRRGRGERGGPAVRRRDTDDRERIGRRPRHSDAPAVSYTHLTLPTKA